jgi:hypothetical protein
MSFSLINIRLLQIKRALKQGGLGSVLLPFFIVGLSLASFKAFQDTHYGLLVIGLLLMVSISIHLKRQDKRFSRLFIANWHTQMYLEYVLLSIPFAATALLTPNYFLFPLLLLALWLVPYIKYTPTQKTVFKNISKLFPASYAIEWISGIRVSFLSFITLYLFAIITCWMRFLPLLLLWLITTMILNFYNEHEALQILKAQHNHAKNFLNQKIKKHCMFLIYLYSPVLFLNALFNPDFIDINILFMLVQLALLIFAINAKYASYIPSQQNLASNITVAIISIGSIVPYLLPLPIIFAISYYNKALKNLNPYFNDSN